MRFLAAAIFSYVRRAILLGVWCVLGLPNVVDAQAEDAEMTANGEVHDDRPAATAHPRGPDRAPLTLDREAPLGLSPAYTFVGLGVTASLGGVLVWSLVNTLEASERYKANPTPARYDDGRRRVRRTWLLGTSCALTGMATMLIAILGTDWGEDERLSLLPDVGPDGGSLALTGRF